MFYSSSVSFVSMFVFYDGAELGNYNLDFSNSLYTEISAGSNPK